MVSELSESLPRRPSERDEQAREADLAIDALRQAHPPATPAKSARVSQGSRHLPLRARTDFKALVAEAID